jgi:hypothetical protein
MTIAIIGMMIILIIISLFTTTLRPAGGRYGFGPLHQESTCEPGRRIGRGSSLHSKDTLSLFSRRRSMSHELDRLANGTGLAGDRRRGGRGPGHHRAGAAGGGPGVALNGRNGCATWSRSWRSSSGGSWIPHPGGTTDPRPAGKLRKDGVPPAQSVWPIGEQLPVRRPPQWCAQRRAGRVAAGVPLRRRDCPLRCYRRHEARSASGGDELG